MNIKAIRVREGVSCLGRMTLMSELVLGVGLLVRVARIESNRVDLVRFRFMLKN